MFLNLILKILSRTTIAVMQNYSVLIKFFLYDRACRNRRGSYSVGDFYTFGMFSVLQFDKGKKSGNWPVDAMKGMVRTVYWS